MAMTGSKHAMCAPGPRGVALWHSLRQMRRSALTEYQRLRGQFGDVVRLATLPHPVYLVSHPDAVQYVLRDNARNYRKGLLFKPIAALQGQGLLTSEGDLWMRQRRLVQPVFHRRQLATFTEVMVDEARTVVQEWHHPMRTGTPVNVAERMNRLTFNVVGRALLGAAPGALDAYWGTLRAIAVPLLQFINARATRPWAPPLWVPTPRNWRFRRAVAVYDALVQQIIAARRQARQRGGGQAMDMLALLLAACDDTSGAGMSERQLRDEVITFIGAGAETSAHALSWTWYLLARHPEVARRVHTELDTVLSGRMPTQQDLPHLPYSRMVLAEALRLYPPSVVLPRQANAPDKISGYAIPKDAVVVISQYVTHRHPEFWSEPEQFQPERFTPEQEARRHRCAYIPFGEGPRRCIGEPFALLEMHLVLATLAQAYTLQVVPEHPVVPEVAVTLRPRDGLWMTVHARQ
jgi:cytochrome P450